MSNWGGERCKPAASVVPVVVDRRPRTDQARADIGSLNRTEAAAGGSQEGRLVADVDGPPLKANDFARRQRSVGNASADADLLPIPRILQRASGRGTCDDAREHHGSDELDFHCGVSPGLSMPTIGHRIQVDAASGAMVLQNKRRCRCKYGTRKKRASRA